MWICEPSYTLIDGVRAPRSLAIFTDVQPVEKRPGVGPYQPVNGPVGGDVVHITST